MCPVCNENALFVIVSKKLSIASFKKITEPYLREGLNLGLLLCLLLLLSLYLLL